jgi:DNA primase small subunit
MKASTAEFLRQCFSAYYTKGAVTPPPSLPEREWGFIRFDPAGEVRMRRHIGFCSRQELDEYIRSMIPSHIYYSSAYYQTPGAPTMDAKKWTGADLIFDLDADHLMRGPYPVMLSRVKDETVKLIAMLTEELGFPQKKIDVVFSGGRGYHIHIRDPAVRSFGSSERRELIDYVCGTGIDPGAMIGGVRSSSPRGWRRRYIASMIDYLAWLEGLPGDEALAGLETLPGIGEAAAGRFLGAATELSRKLKDGIPLSQNDRVIWPVIRELSAAQEGPLINRLRERAALADEPVTTDIKRLIRLPTSLHGGSGFRVTPVSLGELAEFDPLIDAVVFGTRDIQVDLAVPLSMDLLGSTYKLEKGISTVPEALAVFLCCRGVADLAGGG